MQQRGGGQKPAVDLRMVGGRGHIRGISGTDDRGETFANAGQHLLCLAHTQGEFEWVIDFDIEFGPTTSIHRLLELIDTLDEIARDSKLRGDITLNWNIPANDISFESTARNAKKEIEKKGEGGLKLEIALIQS